MDKQKHFLLYSGIEAIRIRSFLILHGLSLTNSYDKYTSDIS